ncbi:MAG TPA: ATP-binding protein [Flavobacterium sp.]|nr:ATP-binding protein [Flavobacterium sp.]
MKSAYLYKSSLVIKIALGTAILLIIYISCVFFNQMQNLGNSVESMSVSNKRLLELEKILSTISVNESSVNTFIITGDSTYLQKRFAPKESLRPQFERLRKFTAKSTKNFNCDSLQALIDARYDLFDKVLESAKSDHLQPNFVLNFQLAKSDTITDKIRDYVYQSLDNEASNVNQYQIDHRYEIETSIITSFLLVTVALFILLISLRRISSDLKDMKKLNEELQFLNYTFNNAEKIAGISHWKYNLRTRKYSFSDNFYNLIGLNPETFEPSMENVLPYLHPDDRDRVVEAYTHSLTNKTPTSLIFRLYRKNGDMRYIKSIGSFAENSRGELVKIGVNYDITEQYQNTISLEENNKDLRIINAELESFNNIVSHDLQEPLRKIQMFISRIDENEFTSLSETGQDYFKRISASANRMQNLLIDLVNYSRAMKGDKAFVKTNLNEIVAEVLNELAANIEEKNAVIHVGNLPSVNVIPFQIHQLFINLLANSIKFSKQDTPPEINISREKIVGEETHDNVIFADKQYYKIVVSDNGIGFRQEFADKIFQLFRRLEKESYEGTGIGLAICKKIIENHNGFIFAESEEGIGAKFIIYLPR